MEILGLILEVIGTVMIALTVLNVHDHMAKHHKIDAEVISDMRRERKFAFLGIFFVSLGTIMQIIYII